MANSISDWMKRFASIWLIVFMISGAMVNISAATYAKISREEIAQVIQVIDGESMKVRLENSGSEALVKLLGVDATGNAKAFEYLNSRLSGRYVTLRADANVPVSEGRWNRVYVLLDTTLINEEILKKGYALVNADHKLATRYKDFLSEQEYAQKSELNRWAADDTQQTAIGRGVNINTATTSQLASMLSGVGESLAYQIKYYRDRNPFNSLGEIKFVPGFTKAIFDANRHLLSVSTNLNAATEDEINTLINVSKSSALTIVTRRAERNFATKVAVYDRGLMSEDTYSKNEKFMDVKDKATIEYRIPDAMANMNTASRQQLVNAGCSEAQADVIISNRRGIPYKTLEEIERIDEAYFYKSRFDALEDNLTQFTDVNSADITEIRSLLGDNELEQADRIYKNRPYSNLDELKAVISSNSYNKLSAFVYFGTNNQRLTNINTASREQLIAVGFIEAEANALISFRPFKNAQATPFSLNKFYPSISLCTNINKAAADELQTLGKDITSEFINRLISYRNEQPFGSKSEVRTFFESNGFGTLYSQIENYVVLR